MELRVRVAVPADLAEIDQLLSWSYPALLARSYPPSLLVTALPILSRANPRLLSSGTYFAAEAEGRIVGVGGWTRAGPGAVAQVRHVVTERDRVRQGVGRAVMERVLSTARESGVRRLDCQATLMAVPFYRAMGFRDLGPMTISLRPGIDFPVMAMVCDLRT